MKKLFVGLFALIASVAMGGIVSNAALAASSGENIFYTWYQYVLRLCSGK